MPDTPFPSNGTDAEKRAWAAAQTAPKPKAAAPKAPAPKSEEDKMRDELKNMRYFQATDDHQ